MKLLEEIKKNENSERAQHSQYFFKTGKGEYGEGDLFLGITVPVCRQIAKKYKDISLKDLKPLMTNKYHEVRLIAIIILTLKYKENPKEIYEFYLNNLKGINNWDLVDVSCHKIIGEYLKNKEKSQLYKLAKSNDLWEKRISIVSTFTFIRNNQFEDTINISELLLKDKHDLIHKAVGWMLRELGKRDILLLEAFLDKNTKNMPRTMLRYAIEKFDKDKKLHYMKL